MIGPRRSIGIALVAMAIWLVALVPAVDAHGGTATLQLPTTRLNPGGTLELVGDMAGEGPVELYLIAADGVVRSLGTATADEVGHFRVFIALPSDLPTGAYAVIARSAVEEATNRLTIGGLPLPVDEEGRQPEQDDVFAGSGSTGAQPQPTGVAAVPVVGGTDGGATAGQVAPARPSTPPGAVEIIVAVAVGVLLAVVLGGFVRLRARKA